MAGTVTGVALFMTVGPTTDMMWPPSPRRCTPVSGHRLHRIGLCSHLDLSTAAGRPWRPRQKRSDRATIIDFPERPPVVERRCQQAGVAGGPMESAEGHGPLGRGLGQLPRRVESGRAPRLRKGEARTGVPPVGGAQVPTMARTSERQPACTFHETTGTSGLGQDAPPGADGFRLADECVVHLVQTYSKQQNVTWCYVAFTTAGYAQVAQDERTLGL